MTSEAVTEEKETPDEVLDEVVTEAEEQKEQPVESEEVQEEKKEEFVPVSAHVAERKKRQEAEQKAQWLEQQMMHSQQPKQEVVDNSDDLLTVGQQKQHLEEWRRSILEEAYMEQNPEMIERIKDELPEILGDPRHKWLADTIAQAPNRLQRAAQVLNMVKPKKQAAPAPNRQNIPKSPQSVSKTNKLSQADRIMEMSDQELEDWRVSQKRKVR
jgi:hypothetical protein